MTSTLPLGRERPGGPAASLTIELTPDRLPSPHAQAGTFRRPLHDLLTLARDRVVKELCRDQWADADEVSEMLARVTHLALATPVAGSAQDGRAPDASARVPSRYATALRGAVLDIVACGDVTIDAFELAHALR